ncbi:MAG: HD-GYP domain-containing protein [Caldilineaceae bacterium]|nr:HD-GYP domain-containing protein [Caldilineaceae bacterium]
MKPVAWTYLAIVWSAALIFVTLSAISSATSAPPWKIFLVLTVAASLMRIFVVDAPHYRSYEGSTIVFVIGIWLLPPLFFILLVVIAHTVEWLKERWTNSNLLRNWYIQPFNAAKTIVSGWGAYGVLQLVSHQQGVLGSQLSLPNIFLLMITYVLINQALLAIVLFLARGITPSQAAIFHDGLLIELPLAAIGCVASALMELDLWMGILVLGPILLIYQAFRLPRLQYDAMQSLASVNSELTVANHSIQQLNDELFLTLAKIFDARDPYVGNHAAQVAAYAVAIATELGFSQERIEIIRQSGYLHDIGKIAIPEAILHKPAKLTEQEVAFIRKHANLGADFVATSHGLRHLAPFIRHHHERWDGRGYPDGLVGEAIPLEARILNVCDSVEAMASDRPYSRAKSVDEIVTELRACAGNQFDPAVVAAFIQIAECAGTSLIINSARSVHLHAEAKQGRDDSAMVDYLAEIYGMAPTTLAPTTLPPPPQMIGTK